jgi:hypothetical protein
MIYERLLPLRCEQLLLNSSLAPSLPLARCHRVETGISTLSRSVTEAPEASCMLWGAIHLETGEQAGSAKPATRFFLFLFIGCSETRYGARRCACLKLSYSPPYRQAENSAASLLRPLAATSYPYKLPKHILDTDVVPENPK